MDVSFVARFATHRQVSNFDFVWKTRHTEFQQFFFNSLTFVVFLISKSLRHEHLSTTTIVLLWKMHLNIFYQIYGLFATFSRPEGWNRLAFSWAKSNEIGSGICCFNFMKLKYTGEYRANHKMIRSMSFNTYFLTYFSAPVYHDAY